MFNYPYTNFHRLNLDWIVSKIEQIERGDYTPVNFKVANVLDYGAVGNGVEDDTDAITAAVTTGLPVYFPVGTYVVSRPITPAGEGQMFSGAGYSSIIRFSGSSAFDCNGIPKIFITNLSITEDNPHRFANYAISNMSGQFSGVHRVNIAAFSGIEHGANSGIVSDCAINCVSIGIKIYNGDNTSTIENCIIGAYDWGSTSDSGYGILVEDGACANLKNVSTLLKDHGVHFSGTFFSFNAIQCWFDHCKNGFFFDTGSHSNRFRINNCWFSSSESDVLIHGKVEGMWFENCEFYRTEFAGIWVNTTAKINNLNVTNCWFGCTTNASAVREAIHLYDVDAENIIISNNNFSSYDDTGNYNVAISLTQRVSGIIIGNCLRGATTPITGAGTNMTVVNNAV